MISLSLVLGSVESARQSMGKKDVEAIILVIAICLSLWLGFIAGINHG